MDSISYIYIFMHLYIYITLSVTVKRDNDFEREIWGKDGNMETDGLRKEREGGRWYNYIFKNTCE